MCVCFGQKMPPRCAFYAGEMIKCRMLWCVTRACHLQETATILENWLVRGVWPCLCLTVSDLICMRARARACTWVV